MRYLHPILMYPLRAFNWQAFCPSGPWWGYKCHKYRRKTNIMNPIVPGSQKDGFGTGSVPGLSHEPTADFSINAECLGHLIFCYDMVGKGFPGGSVIKNLPAYARTQAQSMGQEDPLEKKMSTYFIILVWRIPWTEEPGRLWSMRLQRVKHDWTWVRW